MNKVLLDDLVNVLNIDIAVPSPFRINHHHWTFGATIQATGAVNTDFSRAGETQILRALLGIIAHRLCIEALATRAAIFTQIGTEEHVMFVVSHRTPFGRHTGLLV